MARECNVECSLMKAIMHICDPSSGQMAPLALKCSQVPSTPPRTDADARIVISVENWIYYNRLSLTPVQYVYDDY